MNTISTCIIVKNEIDNLPKLIDDLRQFSDEIIVVDTGSDDGTYEWLLDHQDSVLKVDYFKWIKNFAAARNYSFSKATMDWIFWCDADDRISKNLINKINSYKSILGKDDINSYYINYQFGKETFVPRLRILKRSDNPIWIGACHEYVWYHNDDDVHYSYELVNDTDLIVHQHEQGHASRNLPIFINMILRQKELSGRDIYYLSNELRDNGYIEKSIYAAKQCLFMPDMCMFDCWNAMIYNLYDYWTANYTNAIEGIETIVEFEKINPMRSDVYYLLCILYDIVGDTKNAMISCRKALRTKQENIFNYGEVEQYSKILPAIYIYNNTSDDVEKQTMLNYLDKYKDHPNVIELINTVKNKGS